jgi:hypothetical protein
MKGKYITTQILLACLSKPRIAPKDIHTQLRETIAEHKRMVEEWERTIRKTTVTQVMMFETKAA